MAMTDVEKVSIAAVQSNWAAYRDGSVALFALTRDGKAGEAYAMLAASMRPQMAVALTEAQKNSSTSTAVRPERGQCRVPRSSPRRRRR
jgi:hypothetical protein